MNYLICGGSCSGKSTFSELLSDKLNFPVYHVDEHIDGDHLEKFNNLRHPINHRIKESGIYWLFDLSKEDYVKACVRSANEDLEFVKEDTGKLNDNLIIEGLWAEPSLVNSAFPDSKIIWLFPSQKHQAEVWAKREWTKDVLSEHKNPDEALRKWIEGDYAMSLYLERKAAGTQNSIYILNTDLTVYRNFNNVMRLLDL